MNIYTYHLLNVAVKCFMLTLIKKNVNSKFVLMCDFSILLSYFNDKTFACTTQVNSLLYP